MPSSEFYTPINMTGLPINNLLDPVNPQDAATKAYVDANAGVAKGVPYVTVAPAVWWGGPADYQGDGIDDSVAIQDALDFAATNLNSDSVPPPVLLLPGDFFITSVVTLAVNATLMGVLGYSPDGSSYPAQSDPSPTKVQMSLDAGSGPVLDGYTNGGNIRNLNILSVGDIISVSGILVENLVITTSSQGAVNYAIMGSEVVRNCVVIQSSPTGALTIETAALIDSTLSGVSVSNWISMSNAAQLGVPNGTGVPGGSPASNGWWMPFYHDNTAVTGGLYMWNPSTWTKISTL